MSHRISTGLAAGNLAFLQQGLALIEHLSDDQYAADVTGGRRGGVGAHFRHVFDHYECFLAGLGEGRIDYDRRGRDLDVESSRSAALEKAARLRAGLEGCLTVDADRPLVVLVDCGERDQRFESRSTFARELQFLVSHTVHHYAVIALLLRSRGVEPGTDFGVAPSTLKYEQGNTACAR